MSVAMLPPDVVPPGDPSSDASGAAHEELLLVGEICVNMLLIGVDGAIRRVVDLDLLRLRSPIAAWRPGDRLVLPPVDEIGTMILHEVEVLPLDDQARLLEWLEHAAGRTRVISTTSTHLLPQVQSGAFMESLYYRLNTVCVNLSAA